MMRVLRLLLAGSLFASLAAAGQPPGDDARNKKLKQIRDDYHREYLETQKTPNPSRDYRWEDEAKKHGLGEDDIRLLRRHKFVITGAPFRQIFTPYVGSRVPVFITTDSLLNGFHVLFEESVYRLEQAQARKLPGTLARIESNLDKAAARFGGNPALLAAATRRARLFLGIARHLLDEKAIPKDADLRATIQEETRRIATVAGNHKPAWLGKPDAGVVALDYSRFKPRGFYTKSSALERYFRAVSWLQAIPFRLDHDEELVALFVLYRAADEPGPNRDVSLWQAYRRFLGTGDDWDLLAATWLPEEITPEGLAAVREKYRDKARRDGGPQINDQIRFPPTGSGGKLEIGFRFLSAYRIPEGVLFQRTMGPKLAKRDFPTGLEVCAVLGSPFARDKLAREFPKVMRALDETRPLFKAAPDYGESSLYGDYLRCLGMLLERTEPDAPAFMRGEAWQAKTCMTALAGWAQIRHTWDLQAKQSEHYLSDSSSRAGFVEPVPEFYARLAELVKATHEVLESAGAVKASDWKKLPDELRAVKAIVDRARKQKKGLDALTAEEIMLLARFDPRLDHELDLPAAERNSDAVFNKITRLLAECPDLEKALSPDEVREVVAVVLLRSEAGLDVNLASNWKSLGNLCQRLERLAHKQLRQVPFSDQENEFILGYGERLAHIMLYGGNSYIRPRDDSPRIIDVFSNPLVGKHLLVGTARPRHLWVLYPVKGVDVLCRGAVLPYHEFAHPTRLSDAEWKALLDSPQRPELPAWVRPVFGGSGESAGRKVK